METDIGEIPIHYFLSTYELVKKSVPASFVLTMLNGGYLTFLGDAEIVSQILQIPLYAQEVLNHSKPVPYCFIPMDGFGENLDTIMDVQGSGVVLADKNPGVGIETFAICPHRYNSHYSDKLILRVKKETFQMKFVDAKKLHDEDEVIVKKTGCVLHVLGDVEVDGKDVFIPCDDGKLYHHTAVK